MEKKHLREVNKSTLQDTLDKFNIVEFAAKKSAKNGKEYWDRHYFCTLSENFTLDTKENNYRSHFIFTSDIEKYCVKKSEEGKESIAGYDGPIWIDYIILDIDNENNPNESLKTLRQFLDILENNYEVDLRHIRVNYSGSKGFHVRIPSILFNGFEPSPNLHLTIQNIVKSLTDGLDYFDDSIYNKTSLIRVVNTCHGKTKLYSIPLTIKEVKNLTIENIRDLSKQPREVDYLDENELAPLPSLITLKEECGTLSKKMVSKSISIMPVKKGNRHNSRVKLVGHLVKIGVPFHEVLEFILARNKMSNSEDREEESLLITETENMYESWRSKSKFFFYDKKDELKINIYEYIKTLELFGFAKYYADKNYSFVKTTDHCLEEVKISHIKDYVREYLENIEDGDNAYSSMLDRGNKYFGDELLEHLKPKNENIMRDTRNTCNFFFKNNIVQVGGEGQIIQIPYSEATGLIWKNQLIGREFKETKEKGDFEKFLFNAVNKSEERFNSLRSIIGYLLHSYKNPSLAKAIILCDEKISDNPVGRTGKSFIGRAVGKLRNRLWVDGKYFNPDGPFVFQQVSLGTQLIDYNDVKKNFPFERFFSIITDDMTTEKKRMDAMTIPFSDSPKILISTNFTIKGVGDSYKDRKIEFEFSDYYNADHKPIDDFGKLFFDEWDEEEWNRFFNFMIGCAAYYLRNGIQELIPINIRKRKIIELTCADFYDFAVSFIQIGKEYDKSSVYGDYLLKYPTDKPSSNTFTSWLKSFAGNMEFEYNLRQSNGRQLFSITQ